MMFCFLLSDQTVKLTQFKSAKEPLQVDISTGTDEANGDSINLHKKHMLYDHTNVALLSFSLSGLSLPVLFWFPGFLCFSSFFSCQHKSLRLRLDLPLSNDRKNAQSYI